MPRSKPVLTGVERTFHEDEIIVSKTDLKGIITYANPVFTRICGYSEEELLGQPHNIIRHPHMPRCVFKLLWDTIEDGREIFAYVVNLCKSGDHYWVYAHVTPTFDAHGNIVSYHSSRRVPSRAAIAAVEPIYAALKACEDGCEDRRLGMQASMQMLLAQLEEAGVSYEQFVFSLV